jgi:phage baseplate assembly protein W
MGNREDDLNPDQWIGLQFPLTYRGTSAGDPSLDDIGQAAALENYTEAGFFPRTQTLRQQASYNLRNLLQTIPGERLGIPEYGSRLHHLLFEPMDEELYSKIEDEIRDSVRKWLPYLEIKKIDVYKSATYDNYVNVSIEFNLVGDLDVISGRYQQSLVATVQKIDIEFQDFGQTADSDKLAD